MTKSNIKFQNVQKMPPKSEKLRYYSLSQQKILTKIGFFTPILLAHWYIFPSMRRQGHRDCRERLGIVGSQSTVPQGVGTTHPQGRRWTPSGELTCEDDSIRSVDFMWITEYSFVTYILVKYIFYNRYTQRILLIYIKGTLRWKRHRIDCAVSGSYESHRSE